MAEIEGTVQAAEISEDGDRDEYPEGSPEDILEDAKARMRLAEEAEREIRALALEDMEFRSGRQWHANIEQDRNRDGRPCLVINRLPQFVQQVTNDQRQNRPAIKVHPVDSAADVDTAKIIQGLIRHIEYNSNAETAYDTAFESAVIGGFGYFRIITDFVGPDSFDQEILIERIRDPHSVYLDPYSQKPDGSDANWAFIVEDLPAEEYRAKYPDSLLSKAGADWLQIGREAADWVKADSAVVAEYFYKESREETLHLLSTGEAVRDADLQGRLASASAANLNVEVVRSRKTRIPVIKWCKINGVEVLEQTVWPGSYIPVIPVYGAELFSKGKRTLEGVIRNAKDSQRMYNYWASAETEAIALAPRTPWLIAEGQVEGYEEMWNTANRRNHAYLPYKPVSVGGQPVGAPQRQAFEPAVQAITNARMIAADDLKATTGIYDAALGKQSPDSSGVAIQRRTNQSQTSNFHFTDNLTRSMKHAGRVLVDLIPHIYDTARAARIIGDEDEQKIVTLNQQHVNEQGEQVLYDLSVGRYDVTVDTGPSFASKRQEASVAMMEVSRAVPQIMQIAGDLMVKNMDWPGAQEIAERIKKTLPPGLADDSKGKKPLPPEVQAQMQQMQGMIQQLTQHLNEATHTIETKKMELESKERIEMAKLQVDVQKTLATLEADRAQALLVQEIAGINRRLEMLNVNEPIDADHSSASDPAGAMGADQGQGAVAPTGGPSPGTPMGV